MKYYLEYNITNILFIKCRKNFNTFRSCIQPLLPDRRFDAEDDNDHKEWNEHDPPKYRRTHMVRICWSLKQSTDGLFQFYSLTFNENGYCHIWFHFKVLTTKYEGNVFTFSSLQTIKFNSAVWLAGENLRSLIIQIFGNVSCLLSGRIF